MNRKLVLRLLGAIMLIEACAMAPSYAIALIYRDPGDAAALLKSIAILAAIGTPLWCFIKPKEQNLRAREGLVVVALSWVMLSVFGALPMYYSSMFTSFTDALFESASGFTTTGASVLTNFENYPHGVMFWRSFTHWIGGMGVLVLTLALLPQMTGRTSHLVRAESPGPSLSKIVPKMGDSAKILYVIYAVLTVVQFVVLMFAGMSPYDAAIHALGTAGTGGFSNYSASVAAFNSPLIEWIITFFMVLFGINFALFYRVIIGDVRGALRSEELRWYLWLFAGATMIVTLDILPDMGDFFTALRYGSFHVATAMSTTGYATADFNLWPVAAKVVLVMMMFVGGCAGSTAGGIKVVRIGLLSKIGCREVGRTFQPRKVKVVRFEGKGVDESTLNQVSVYIFVYMIMLLFSVLIISFEGAFDFETNFTAALACLNNVGPGLGAVGPTQNFAGYSAFSKVCLSLLMLAGRLELFPMLALFHPAIWRKG